MLKSRCPEKGISSLSFAFLSNNPSGSDVGVTPVSRLSPLEIRVSSIVSDQLERLACFNSNAYFSVEGHIMAATRPLLRLRPSRSLPNTYIG